MRLPAQTLRSHRTLAFAAIVASLMTACAAESQAPPAAAPGAPPASEVAATPAPPAAPPPAPKIPASATEVLAQGRGPLDACYAEARRSHPELGHTSVEITFSLDDNGKPSTVDLLYRNRMDESAKACMRTAAEGLVFPAGLRGKQTGVIHFAP